MDLFLQEGMAKMEELWEIHKMEIEQILDASEDKKVSCSFKLMIDTSESAPSLTTRLSFSEVHTDERKSQLTDPNQGTFTDIEEAAKPQKAPRKGKPAEGEEEEDEE